MKIILAFIFLHYASAGMAKYPAINDVRIMFHKAASAEETCIELINLLDPVNEKISPLLFGYRGCATMLMAKHSVNPFSKLSYFRKGKVILEKAIKADQNNVELRFLRYTIQTNVPSFLNYNDNLEQDRTFLTRVLPELKDKDLKPIISSYLKKVKL